MRVLFWRRLRSGFVAFSQASRLVSRLLTLLMLKVAIFRVRGES
jgi:hypothetical protein